ncbi:TPA: TetR family transcriptional regulator [Salmonella enterica subsp. enterica serovar Orion]|uniref:TetR family transcriptional regulator n=1 Tax=Salmonella enterica TaxID=28901 RepID=UPI000F6FD508|nr:TetR family transcriptional regulator [Salmonella enterica subsp. enterica serovar Bareilly]EAA0559154.1 TetR family transcriptional regulator [Salmonella enterica subsp. enterica serovar Lexington]EAA7888099.1 TetR family transcriptional regulator [Salmonella enterica]EAO0018478.1 TetR family transcriptional regulator [Salmonella enterica subsp. enterica serovar Amsterdam var. 15+,34+]EBG0408145.1 TetR family transcriptional regulator [Salmonella enterica subsp. enterica serovar Irumu]EBN9
MSYLNRDERREVILQAAMRVALAEGFSAMTVRRIASEADVAAGQVHHHFSSAGELKALAFVHLIRTLLDAGQVPPPATWRARLHAMLGSEDGGFEPYIKLWREAQILADRDPHIRDAYLLTMQMWHEETVTIIEQGKQAGEFTFTANATDIAWRLIALVCGLDGMYVLGIPEMADPAFKYHLDRMITLELFA